FDGAVQISVRLAGPVQLVNSFVRSLTELANCSKLDRFRRACLRARGFETALQPVVAQRALLRGVRHRIDLDHAERTRRDAVTAAVARVRLNHDGVELGTDDRARRTHPEAPRLDALLADVAH